MRAAGGSRERRKAEHPPTPALADGEISPREPRSATDCPMMPSREQLANSYARVALEV